jgi:Uma2 family endonuclease
LSKERHTKVKKTVHLSSTSAEQLSNLARSHRMTEDQVFEKALHILFSLVENFDPRAEQRGWLILPERLLLHRWDPENDPLPIPEHRHTMSYDEFLEWADEDTLTEWVDGEVIIATPTSDRDVVIREFLHNVLRIYVSVNKQGIVRLARFQMKLERSGREPDLLFVKTEHLDRLRANHLDGPADMVVEISNPDSIGRDRGEKYYEYERAGIPEYWLVDPVRQWAEFYVLDETGHYQPAANGKEGRYHSTILPGFWLRMEWLWQPPPILQALRDLQIISAANDE